MGEFVHVYNDGGGIRDVQVPPSSANLLGSRGQVAGYGPVTIAAIGTPFVILPGDGSATGMFFTNSAGAFTLTAGAILTNTWKALKGCWIYLPANFGGRTYSAGWYWAVFSSDTAGILYTDTYTSGVPIRPVSPTPFPVNLTGWLTQTTAEITGPTGFTLVGGSMGPSGVVKTHWRIIGNTTSTKTFKEYLGLTSVAAMGITTSPLTEMLTSIFNQGDQQKQVTSTASALTGVGTANATFTASSSATVATDVDQTISFSLQVATNTACAILLHADVTVTYGA